MAKVFQARHLIRWPPSSIFDMVLLRLWALLFLVIAVFFPLSEAAQTVFSSRQEENRRNVVLISIDGLRTDYLQQASHFGLRLPNLFSMVENGKF